MAKIPDEAHPYHHLAAAIILAAAADIMVGCGKHGSKQKSRYLSAIRFVKFEKKDSFIRLAAGL